MLMLLVEKINDPIETSTSDYFHMLNWVSLNHFPNAFIQFSSSI